MLDYRGTKGQLITFDGLSELFEGHAAGGLQGDKLAPFIFVIAVDYVLIKIILKLREESGCSTKPRRFRRHPAENIKELDFADDIPLLSENTDKHKDCSCLQRSRLRRSLHQ